jgi:heme-degrading monooxygenase HmoA
MIARTWRCTASEQGALDYLHHFDHAVVPELQQISGYSGAYVLRREIKDGVELTVMTFWESMAAIREFAGNPPSIAVVAPAAQAVLRTFDATVEHAELVRDQRHA